MVALAVRHEALSNEISPVMLPDRMTDWGTRLPIMRAFPRLAIERIESPVEARWDEEPERWDGMA